MKHIVIVFFALLVSVLTASPEKVSAQINIEPNLLMPANPSPYLSDWQSQAGSIQLTAVLQQPYNQPVKLAAQVSLNGQIVARTKPENMPMLSLHQGMNSFNAVSIIPYQAISFVGGIDQASQRAGRLPEGNYEICVWFINPETGAALATSPCRPFTIMDVQPPVLISPTSGTTFGRQKLVGGEQTTLERQSCQPITINELVGLDQNALANLKGFELDANNRKFFYLPSNLSVSPNETQNTTTPNEATFHFQEFVVPTEVSAKEPFTFSWLPPAGNLVSAAVMYKLRIVEVLPGQSAAQVLQNGTPVFEQDGISATTFTGTESLSRLFSMTTAQSFFAWSIQAHDIQGHVIGNNNGWAVPNTFTIGGSLTSDNDIPKSFFDIFFDLDLHDILNNNVDVKPEPCGYTYKERLRTMFGPWKMTKSYSQYANTYTRIRYGVYRVVRCTLWKGHGGPHHCSAETFYVKEGEDKETVAPPGPSNPTTPIDPPQYLSDDPPARQQMDPKDMKNIPTKDEADKKEADEKNNNGGNNNGNNNDGTGNGQNGSTNNGSNGNGTGTNSGTGTGTGVGGNTTKPEPCPYEYKKYIRNLYTPCKDGWMEMYGVYEVFKCSLLKGHAGPHHGTIDIVYVHDGRVGCSDNLKGEPLPPGATVITGSDIGKIPTKEKADKGTVTGTANGNNANEPCPYEYKKYIRNLYTPCKDGWMEMYGVYEVFKCSLLKGHAGPHHGTIDIVYVHDGRVGCSDNLKGEPLPAGATVISGSDIGKIPTKEKADKDDKAGAAVGPVLKEPCPEVKKTNLRTVAGSWTKVKTEVHTASLKGKGTYASADVTWHRDIWTVLLVQHCTLEKGHGGDHVWDAGHEEWYHSGGITETRNYGVGVPQTAPTDDAGSSIPQEDPPKGAIFMK
ncbi:MAG: hypothetical protein ACHQM6_00745 [Candidatus Kapaibacterium sp.]